MAIQEKSGEAYRLVIHTEGEGRLFSADDVLIGQMGTIHEPSHPNHGALLFRMATGFVNLENPYVTLRSPSFKIRLLRPSDAVTLIVR